MLDIRYKKERPLIGTHYAELGQLLRTDALTGVGNMIAFYECLYNRMEFEPESPFSLISADIDGLKEVNDKFGRSVGDTTIRWFALVISEETNGQVFRLGGDEFAIIMSDISPEHISSTIGNLNNRMNKEAHQVNLEPPAASIAVINYQGITEKSLNMIMSIFYHVIEKKKANRDSGYEIYETEEIPIRKGLNASTLDMIQKIARVGKVLDQSLQMAYTDVVSGLPNMNAVLQYLEAINKDLDKSDLLFSILLIDGDNLSQYNDISYQLGDNMIKDLGAALKQEMRPDDYLARWRSGDEFLIVLPNTPVEQAQAVGNRLRKSVKQISQEWQFPITISIGLACCPQNGKTVDELIDSAEIALRLAKSQGKDCVAIVE